MYQNSYVLSKNGYVLSKKFLEPARLIAPNARIKNPKSEVLNPKQFQNSNDQNPKQIFIAGNFSILPEASMRNIQYYVGLKSRSK